MQFASVKAMEAKNFFMNCFVSKILFYFAPCDVLSRMNYMFETLDRFSSGQLSPVKINCLYFSDRASLVEQVRALSPGVRADDKVVSPIQGGATYAKTNLNQLDPVEYGSSRNHLDGAVTRLSPYIRHGILSAVDVRDRALETATPKESEKFIQQLAWREYWHRLYHEAPERIWKDVEPYKTGFLPSDYSDTLPEDIARGETGVACIDQFIRALLDTGYVHNHARLYLAGYVCHWRRVKWQAGARWFLTHLLDGDPASNNLSWQWAASTFSHKPYYFNLDNVEKFTGEDIDTRFQTNKPLAGTYEALYEELFPNLGPKP